MLTETLAADTTAPPIVVTGNPNVGKSVLFHALTGHYATVSNYPGTTVDTSRGTTTIRGAAWTVHDTPGLNSLLAGSEDEAVARDLVLTLGPRGIVLQVADAKNLVRALRLTAELAEAGVRTILALNLFDEARERRVSIDVAGLAKRLDIPVVATVATEGHGLDRLRELLPQARPAQWSVRYPALIERAVGRMEPLLPVSMLERRAVALLWLAGDRAVIETWTARLPSETVAHLHAIAGGVRAGTSKPLGLLISHARQRDAQRLAAQVMTVPPQRPTLRRQRLGDLTMHPVWGLPILAGVLGLMYWLVGHLAAQHAVGWLEATVFGRHLTPWIVHVTTAAIPWPWLRALLVGEYGVFTMALPYAFAIILPIVGMFFLCFGLLEDTGYLPRLAVMANRACRGVGLNGKAVLPLMLGLGCDTMATMTTRILDSRRDRILATLLLALGVPCSAQLGVIFAMFAGSPPLALGLWLAIILTVLVVVGRLAARLIPGEATPFLYEIPPLRIPKLSNIVIKTLGRLEWYLAEAVPLFFLGTLTLYELAAIGALARLERLATPLVVGWLRLPADTTAAFLIGFLRRDFGAAGLFAMQRAGRLTSTQVVVSMVTITLFVPCIAQYFMMIKERGWRMATGLAVVVFVIALLTGGVLARLLAATGWLS